MWSLHLVFFNVCQVATRGTAVYFVLADLAHLNNTYQFSLSWFQSAFALAIKISDSARHHIDNQVHAGDSVTDTENGLPRPLEPEEKAELDSRMQRMMDRSVFDPRAIVMYSFVILVSNLALIC